MQLSSSTVAITGATGFLGHYLARAFLARDAHVVAVVRNPARAADLKAAGIEVRKADLADREALARAFRGVDAVVSNAAMLSLVPGQWDAYLRANLEGTRNVYTAIVEAGVGRAVQMSSISVYASHRGRVDENRPLRSGQRRPLPWLAYPTSKALSEHLAWEMAGSSGIDLTALRPSAIFGANDATFTPIHTTLIRPKHLTLYPCYTRFCIVYAGDVAEAACLALERPASRGRAYNVSGKDCTLWEFCDAWRAAGGDVPRWRIPVPVPYRHRYSSERLRAELGWQPRPHVETIRETLAMKSAIRSPA